MKKLAARPLTSGRKLIVIALAAFLVFAITACGSSSSSSSSGSSTTASSSGGGGGAEEAGSGGSAEASYPPGSTSKTFIDYAKKFGPPGGVKVPKETFNVALLLVSTELPSQQSLQLGFEEGAKNLNVDLTVYNAGGYENLSKQVGQFEQAISHHPDAIVVIPASPDALNTEVEKAVEEGIIVMGALIGPSSPKVSYTLADDLELDGSLAVEGLAKELDGKGELLGIFGGAGGAPNTLVVAGAKKELKKYPELKLVYEKNLPNFAASEGQTATEDGLVAHPEVNGILTNNTGFAPGVANALSTAGKEPLPLSGLGPATAKEIEQIEEGTITVAVSPPFYAIGAPSLEWAIAISEGKKPPAPVTLMEPLVLTTETMSEAISSGALFQALAPSTLGCGPGQSSDC